MTAATSNSPLSMHVLLRDTALQVALLADQPVIADPATWRAHCVELVETLQARLKDAGFAPAVLQEISYAQCAMLDECALTALPPEQRDAWAAEPLQVRFFQSYNAGDTVFEQIAALLRQSTPEPALVETYRLLLGLGFLGRYAHEADPERQRTIDALQRLAPPLTSTPELWIKAGRTDWSAILRGWSPWLWLVLISACVALLGIVLQHRLDALLAQILAATQG